MRPRIEFISQDLIEQILDEAFQLLMSPGIKVQDPEVRMMLDDGGAQVDQESDVVSIPEHLGRWAFK